MTDLKPPSVTVTLGWVSDRVHDWYGFCEEVRLNPWCMNEGLADREDEVTISIETAQKYGLLHAVLGDAHA